MAITVKYRVRAPHEVTIISPLGQQFAILFPTIYAQADDPAFPDGMDLYQTLPNGTLEETPLLTFAKIYDAATHTVRNATQGEIDTYAASRAADVAAQQQASAVTLFTTDPIWSTLFRAILREFHSMVDSTPNQRPDFDELMQNIIDRLTTEP